jgi:hypothetical protein
MLNPSVLVSQLSFVTSNISIVERLLELLVHQTIYILSADIPPSTNTADILSRGCSIASFRSVSAIEATVLPAEQVSFPPPELP